MKNLDETIWLPHFWFFLFTLAHSYPDTPNKVTKRKYYDFVQNLPLFLPHDTIRNQFSHLLDEFPVSPYLDHKDSFTYWVHVMNNKLNFKLGYLQKTYLQNLDEYYNHFLPQPLQISDKIGFQKKYIIFTLIICLMFMIIYLS